MSSRKNWLGGLLLIALMLLTGTLLLRGQSASAFFEILRHMEGKYIALGLLLMFAFIACEAVGTYAILRRLDSPVPLHQCLGYSFVGFYFSSITPSATGGQPAQVYCMAKDGVPVARGTLNMMLLSICYQVATLVYGGIAWLMMPQLRANLGGALGLLLLFGGGTMVLLTGLMLLVMFQPALARNLGNATLKLLKKLSLLKDSAKAKETLDRQLAEYGAGAQCIRKNPDLLMKLMALSMLQLTAIYAVPYVVYLAFGLTETGAIEIICLQALLYLAVSNLPLPGTVGAAEGVFVYAFALYFGANLVTPAMLVSRGISFYAFLLLSGAVALGVHLSIRARDRRRAVARLRAQSCGRVRAVREHLMDSK